MKDDALKSWEDNKDAILSAEQQREVDERAQKAYMLRIALTSVDIDAEPDGDTIEIDGVRFFWDDERKVLHATRLCAAGKHATRIERDVMFLADVGRLLAEDESPCFSCWYDERLRFALEEHARHVEDIARRYRNAGVGL